MSERLELLRPILDQYKRRFTILDLGAGIEGYQNIGAEIAREYDAVCVMVERDWVRERFVESRRTIVLKHDINLEYLMRLGECEHFDIVLALNFLHWAPANEWRKWVDAITKLGEKVLVQIPHFLELDTYNLPGREWLRDLMNVLYLDPDYKFEYIGKSTQFEGHQARPMLVLDNKRMNHKLSRTHIEAHQDSSRTEVYADNRQIISYHKGQWQKWIPGINLYNAMKLGMVWPTQKKLTELMRNYKLPLTNHGDVTLHNFVFDGDELHLVDGYDFPGGDDKENLAKVVDKVEVWEI